MTLVARTGFEPVISGLKGRRPGPLDERAIIPERWWAARVSNPRPPACQAGALPAELAARPRGPPFRGATYCRSVPPYIGRRMRRVEDERLITGRGRFAGDIKLEGLVHVAFSRSTVPHARIASIDTTTAKGMPGVLEVWTAVDLPEVAEGLSDWIPNDAIARARPILNGEEVNYVGEAYAVVLAETDYQAHDAAEQVIAELDLLPGVGDVLTATAPNAPRVHHDMDGNVSRRKTVSYGDIASAFGPD